MNLLALKRHRDVLLDAAGNVQPGWTVQVQTSTGAAASIYSDPEGLFPISPTLTTDADGGYSFYAKDGLYRLLISKAGAQQFTVPDLVIGQGGNLGVAVLRIGEYLNATETNVPEAILAALSLGYERLQGGKFGRVIIDCEGRSLGTGQTIVIPAEAGSMVLRNIGTLYPTGDLSYWLETNTQDTAFFDKYQTVSAKGATWSLRKPLLRISSGNTRFEMRDCNFDGKGNAPARLAAGVRVKGNTAGRLWRRGQLRNIESYCVFLGDDAANTGWMDLEGIVAAPNSRVSAADRTSYGYVLSGNDMHWHRVGGWDAHCPLLVGQYGATTFFSACDFYNGADFTDPANFHRLVEYRGNTCTFTGGRLGNGQIHVWNPSLAIVGTKFGITEGSGPDGPPSVFEFHSSRAGEDLAGFVLQPSDVPFELASSTPWFAFDEAGGGTWDIDTAKLGSLSGSIEISGRKRTIEVMGADSSVANTLITGMEGSYLAFEDSTSSVRTAVGAVGDALRFRTNDVDKWEVLTNGNLRPVADNVWSLGAPAYRVKDAAITAHLLNVDDPTLDTNRALAPLYVNTDTVRLKMRGADGVSRYINLGPFGTDPSTPLGVGAYSTPPGTLDNTTNLTTAIQALLTAAETPALSGGVVWGRGDTVRLPYGVATVSPGLVMSRRTCLAGAGGLGSTVLKASLTGVAASGYILNLGTAADGAGSVEQGARIRDLSIQGQLQTAAADTMHAAGYTVGGLNCPTPDTAGRPGPDLESITIGECSGTGINVEADNDGFRWRAVKVLGCRGWGARLNQCNDVKIDQLGLGGNTLGQLWVTNCHSLTVGKADMWPSRLTDTRRIYTGGPSLLLEGSNQCSFGDAQIEGPIWIRGDNDLTSGTERHQQSWNKFHDGESIVETGVANSSQWAAGNLDAIVKMEDATGTVFANWSFRYLAEGVPSADQLTKTPNFIFKFTSLASTQANACKGDVHLRGVALYHRAGNPDDTRSGSVLEYVPFKVNVCDPADRHRLIWYGTYPGQIVQYPSTAVPANALPCDGRAVAIGFYKLLWCMLNPTGDLSTKTNPAETFTLPNYGSTNAAPGHIWCVIVR